MKTHRRRAVRYQLAPYRGPATRTTCPACGKGKAFVPYLDTRTGEPLPEPYGRCNRESNCGHHLSPYQAGRRSSGPSGLSYADDVYQRERAAWKNQPGSPLTRNLAHRPPMPTPNLRPVLSIPDEVFTASLRHYDRNQFARLLRQHFGMGVAAELLARYQIGTSSFWPGATVFWYIDEKDRKRGGQVVLFDEQGHTARKTRPDGEVKRCTSWVHTALAVHCQRQHVAAPDWLDSYIEHADKSPCLFGLPQLLNAPPTQPVAVVEAPKTAVLCTLYFPQFSWLAVGALSYLNAERMAPLRGRNVVLFPDLSEGGTVFSRWSSKAGELSKQGFSVSVSDYLERHATDEQRAAGADLADYLLDGWEGYPPGWDNPPPD